MGHLIIIRQMDQLQTYQYSFNPLRPSDAIWWQEVWVNIGSGNGLVPNGTKPLPKPMLTNHQWCAVAHSWGQFHWKWSRYLSLIHVCVWKLLKIAAASSRGQWVKNHGPGWMPQQNGQHFAQDIFKYFFLMKIIVFWIESFWGWMILFPLRPDDVI